MKTKKPKCKTIPQSTPATGSAAELHAALAPLSDGCMLTATKAYKLCGKCGYDKHAALAVNLAAETLEAINKIMESKRQNAQGQARRD